MKTISLLLFIVVTTTRAQDQKKNNEVIKAQRSGDEKMLNPQPLPPKANIKH